MAPAVLALAIGLAVAHAAPATRAETVYVRLLRHYDAIRAALSRDSTRGVRGHAEGMLEEAYRNTDRFDASGAGVPEARSRECRKLLVEIAAAARTLSRADGLDAARRAFAALSAHLVRYRQMTADRTTVVFRCPSDDRVWIQPAGDPMGDPYRGAGAEGCGNPVAD